MLNKESIIEILNKHNFPTTEYWVLSGSALALHDVREKTNDIDIGCTTLLFDELVRRGYVVEIKFGGRVLTIDDTIEVFENWHVDAIVSIENIPVGSLEGVRAHKVKTGRDKDLKDIELIDNKLLNRK